MRIKLVSFDGNTAINNESSFKTSFLIKKGQSVFKDPKPGVKLQKIVGRFPEVSSIQGAERRLSLRVILVGAPSDPFTQRDTITGLFDVTDYTGTLKTLIIKDEDNSDKQWQLSCLVIGSEWKSEKEAIITLIAPDPVWKAVTQTTQSDFTITASPDTDTFTAGGNVDTPLFITIKPTGARSGTGMAFRRFVDVRNAMTNRWVRGALNIANSEAGNGLDTAALTTAKMQADGDDLVIFVDGQRRDRELQDMDTTSTEIWTRLSVRPKLTAKLGTAIAGSGDISTIDLGTLPTNSGWSNLNQRFMARAPSRGQVIIGSEYFKYKGKDIESFQLKNVKRDAFGSAQAAHSVGDTIELVPYVIWLLYGDSAAVDTNSADASDIQPVFRTDSENDRLDFDEFSTDAGTRGNEWTSEMFFRRPLGRQATGEPSKSTIYTASAESNSDEPDFADPSTFMGMQLRPVQSSTSDFVRTVAVLRWDFFHPVGIDSVTISGRIYATDTDNWPLVRLLYSIDGQNWFTKWTEAAPASDVTWANHSKNASAQALGGTFRYVRLSMRGAMPGGATEKRALVEYSDVELSLVTGNALNVSIGSEIANQYEFKNTVIKNDTTGKFLTLKNGLVVAVNETIVIDTENRDMYLEETNENLRQYLSVSTYRPDWLTAQGGVANTFSYTDAGTGNVTVVMKHNDRNN